MLGAFALAIADTFAPAQRRALLLSVVLAFAMLLVLWIGATVLLGSMHLAKLWWLNGIIDILGSLAALFVAWVIFPAMSALTVGFFLEGVVAAIERAHYPNLPPARSIGIGESILSGLRLAAVALFVNLLILPAYLIPVVNLVLYYGLNGYLVGRVYFEQVALRRVEGRFVREAWIRHRVVLVPAGVVIAFLLTVPFVDLAAPIIGTAFMVHLFTRQREADGRA